MTTHSALRSSRLVAVLALLSFVLVMNSQTSPGQLRARDAGVRVGSLSPGPLNGITDVAGVRVGHTTLTNGQSSHTGVTAILPHGGNVFRERVPAAIHVGNGFGKLLGVTQVQELGELETPILLTGTLSVWKVADAMVAWLLAQPDMEEVRSLNPVVGETNDGFLSDIRARPILPEHVVHALTNATGGRVQEGAVGAGTGTVAFGWKGGIGTSSRKLPDKSGDYTVGVLVQSNFGGELTINGVRIGRELTGQAATHSSKGATGLTAKAVAKAAPNFNHTGDGSIMIIVATDAPLSSRNLERLAARALAGLARTGSNLSNGSGDYVIAFSTATECRRRQGETSHRTTELANERMTPLFQAVAEATEEAIYNSLFTARTVAGFRGTIEALPVARVLERLKRAGALQPISAAERER